MINRREFLTQAAGAAAMLAAPSLLRAAKPAPSGRTNILLITADDMNWNVPGCFGGKVPGVTPNIDRLAGEGMKLKRAHVTIALCQPCRSVLMTGRYPHRNGAMGFEDIRPDVTTLGEMLHNAGYLNGVMSKGMHMTPREKFAWDMFVGRTKLGHGRSPKLYYERTRKFLARAKREGKPFFLSANSSDPHRPLHGTGDEKRRLGKFKGEFPAPSRVYKTSEVTVPAFMPPLPWIHNDIAAYYSSAHPADETVGQVLKALDDSGRADNTMVMFLSDHGMPYPFAKRGCYMNSTRTPWIVRWPGKVKPGSADENHFVSGIDFMPTVLEAAGLDAPAGMDGKSFLPVLAGKKQAGRGRVYTVLHKSAQNEPLPIRSVQDERFGYIYNGWADGRDFRQPKQYGGAIYQMMRKIKAGKADKKTTECVEKFLRRTPEELYDYTKDPDALNNLAGDPKHKDTLKRLRGELVAWMKRTKDPLQPNYEEYLKTGKVRVPVIRSEK